MLNTSNKKRPTTEEDAFIPNSEKHNLIDQALKLALVDKVLTLTDVHNELNNTLVAVRPPVPTVKRRCTHPKHPISLIAQGYETTAASSSYVLLMLAMFPHYQQQLHDEIHSSRLADNVDVSADDFAALPLLDRIFKETMRLFPPIPYLTRSCSDELRLGDYTFPAGVEFVLLLNNAHRSSQHYPHPTTFDPDNFLPENTERRHAYSYLPFSGGTRACIGSRYAQFVIKIIVIHVVKRFRLSTALKIEDFRFRMNIDLILLNKHMIQLEERT